MPPPPLSLSLLNRHTIELSRSSVFIAFPNPKPQTPNSKLKTHLISMALQTHRLSYMGAMLALTEEPKSKELCCASTNLNVWREWTSQLQNVGLCCSLKSPKPQKILRRRFIWVFTFAFSKQQCRTSVLTLVFCTLCKPTPSLLGRSCHLIYRWRHISNYNRIADGL